MAEEQVELSGEQPQPPFFVEESTGPEPSRELPLPGMSRSFNNNRPQTAEHGDAKSGNSFQGAPWFRDEAEKVRPAKQVKRPTSSGANRQPKNFANECVLPAPGPTWKPKGQKGQLIIQDKEQLHDEVQKLKQSVNCTKEENVRLRTKVKHCEKELDKRDKTIGGLIQQLQQNRGGDTIVSNKQQVPGTHLILALKKQVKELKAECFAKDEELRKLKKSLKVSVTQEMEVEIKMFSDECTRLKHIIEQVVRQKSMGSGSAVEEQLVQQSSLISELRQECDVLALSLQKQEEENLSLKKQQQQLAGRNPKQSPEEQKRAEGISKEFERKLESARGEIEKLRRERDDYKTQLETEKNKRVKAVIKPAEVEETMAELRIKALVGEVSASHIETKMFEVYRDSEGDLVSVHELARMFARLPFKLLTDPERKFARYLIQSCPSSVENEAKPADLKTFLEKIVSDCESLTPARESELKASVSKKLRNAPPGTFPPKEQTIFRLRDFPTVLSTLNLSPDESDYVLRVMYKESRDVTKLPCQPLLNLISPQKTAFRVIPQSVPVEPAPLLEEGDNEIPRENEHVEVGEDQMVDIAQKCLSAIAEKMIELGVNVRKVYEAASYGKVVDGTEVELVNAMEFIKGIQRLGIHDFQDIEYACLIRLLSLDDTDKYVMIGNFAQIMEDYGVVSESKEQKEEPTEEKKPLDFSALDEISMVILLGLAEYLSKEQMSLYDLFGSVIRKQLVKTKKTQRTVELIESPDFFAVLHGLGIRTEQPEHENLKLFLCINQNYPGKIYLKKLERVAKEFAGNEKLRTQAQKYYQELIDNEAIRVHSNEAESEAACDRKFEEEKSQRSDEMPGEDKVRVVEEINTKPDEAAAVLPDSSKDAARLALEKEGVGRNDVIIDQDTANKVLEDIAENFDVNEAAGEKSEGGLDVNTLQK